MAQNPRDSKPTAAENKAMTTSSSSNGEEQVTIEPQQLKATSMFTILRPGSGMSSSNNTEATASSAITAAEHAATLQQTRESSAAEDQVSALSKTLEGLEMDDEGANMANNDSDGTGLDEFLVNALKNRMDRIFLLKLDREFCSFLNNPSQEQLEFPSLNSYYRMVIHRVANYFKITRVVDPQQKIILFKTEQSAIPALRFSDLVEEEEEQPVKPMKLLKRNPNRPSSGLSASDGSSEPDRRTISIKEREEAYAKARARIFQEDVSAKPKSEGSGTNSRSDSPSVSIPTADSSRQETSDEAAKSKVRKQSNGKKQGSGSARSPDDQGDSDLRQHTLSSPNSRNVSRSTSPSPPLPTGGSDTIARSGNKGLGPNTKQSKGDLAAECADSRRRKSTASNASSSSGTTKTPVGLARTISSSSSQDGFLSPALGAATLTESPVMNSPSSAGVSKAYDYFGQNPNPSSGSVSPMSSGSSRTSFSYPQPGGSKHHRNHHTNSGGGNHGVGPSSNLNSHPSSSGFVKGMNAPVFVPKKPYPKHNNNHSNSGGAFNSGSMAPYPSGPPNHGHSYNNNGTSGPYTHPQLSSSSPWPDRGMPPGHDASFYNPAQDPSMSFQYGNNSTQYPQAGPSIHPPFNTNNHPPHQQHGYHVSSHRGGRRNPSSKSHFVHQQHFQHPQHPQHSRTHPQMHSPQQHHGGNYNTPSSRDDFGFSQGAQQQQHPQRYNRPFDGGNPGQGPPQGYMQDIYSAQSMADSQGGPNNYPMFPGQQQTTSPGENSSTGQRVSYNQKGLYDPNWNQGQSLASGQGVDPASMLYNPALQPSVGSKKPFNNYQPNMSMMGQQSQGPMGSQPLLSMGGPGGGGGGGGHGMYDIERRPPKSAELFDPNGPSSSNSGAGGQGDYPGALRNQGVHDGASSGGAQEGQIMMTMGGERGQQQSQGQSFYPASHHGGPGFNSSYQAQVQPQPHPASSHLQQHHNQQHHNQQHHNQQHHNQQQQSHLTHVPVGMNRSYSSSSSTSYGSGNAACNTGPPQGKRNNLMYDYSVLATPYDGVAKATSPEAERSPSLSHILEIHGFDAFDDIFEDLVLPTGSKLRRLKPSARDPVGQCLVVFKNANLATEALAAFQEGKETWMGPEAKLKFESSSSSTELETEDETAESEDELNSARLQRRFNVRLWTPVLVNSTTPTPAVAGGAGAGINAGAPAAGGAGGNDSPVRDTATAATTVSSDHLGNEEDESVKVEREE